MFKKKEKAPKEPKQPKAKKEKKAKPAKEKKVKPVKTPSEKKIVKKDLYTIILLIAWLALLVAAILGFLALQSYK